MKFRIIRLSARHAKFDFDPAVWVVSSFLFLLSSLFAPIADAFTLLLSPFPPLKFESFPCGPEWSPTANKKSSNASKVMRRTHRKKNGSNKTWRGPNTLDRQVLQSWRGRVPRVPYGGCAYVNMGVLAPISEGASRRSLRLQGAALRRFSEQFSYTESLGRPLRLSRRSASITPASRPGRR